MKTGLHVARATATAREFFREIRGDREAARRAAWITTLPSKDWKGKTVYALRCNGTTGRGPHVMFLTEVILWSLIEPAAFRCPFHPDGAL